MINLRYGAQALPLNLEAGRKAKRVYCFCHYQILNGGLRPRYGYFNGGFSEIQKDFLTPDF